MVAFSTALPSRLTTFCLLAFTTTSASPLLAAPCQVLIDIGPTVECRDVTTPEFSQTHPAEKIVEATFRMSVLLETGRAEELEELRATVLSTERRMRVVDFQPRTALASELAGDIEVCATNDKTQSVNVTLGGNVSSPDGPIKAQLSPGGGIGQTQAHGNKETFRRLAPKQLVLASGTTDAEHGVFFKWRRSSQVALEGSREVTVRFLVPRGWRGDWVELGCESWTVHRNYLGEKLELCGSAQTLVGLYLSGDADAEQAANALVRARVYAASEEARLQEARKNGSNSRANPADLLNIGSLFKPASHRKEQPATRELATNGARASHGRMDSIRPNVPAALDAMRELSGW